jgi:uncharacterized membrane protein
MIGNHYPFVYATSYSWIIISLILIIGALIRHFFNVKHTGENPPYWVLFPIIILITLSIYVSEIGKPNLELKNNKTTVKLIPKIPELILSNAQEIIVSKCSMCHSKEPLWENMRSAPKLIKLETTEDIINNIDKIYTHSVISFAMPPGNISFLESHERAEIGKLYEAISNIKNNK